MAVQETGYRRQVATRAGPAGATVSPESFGAGLGRQMVATGQVMHREALEDYAIERRETANAEWARAQHGLVLAEENQRGIIRELRKSDDPEHVRKVAETWEANRETLLGSISDDDVRQRAAAQFDAAGVRFRVHEADFADVRAVERTLFQLQESEDIRLNAIETGDPQDFPEQLQGGFEAILGLDLPAHKQEQALAEFHERASISYGRRLIELDPEVALAQFNTPELFGHVDPDKMAWLRNSAEAEIRSREVAAARETAEAASGVREAISTLLERDQNGEIIADEDFAAAQAAAVAIGDTSRAEQIVGLRVGNAVNRTWGPENASPLQREQRIAALAGMSKRTPAQDIELAALRQKSPGWDNAYNSDPIGVRMRQGGASAPPAVDLSDASTWLPRIRFAQARGEATPFSKAEAAALGQALAQEGGEARVLAELDKVPGGYDRAMVAEQIAPRDETFRVMAQLQPQVRAIVRRGKQAVGANPQFFKLQAPRAEERLAAINSRLAYALRGLDPEFAAGVQETMRHYIAGNASVNGLTSAEAMLEHDNAERMLSTAALAALGGEVRGGQRYGGLATWGGRSFVLVETLTAGQFQQAVIADMQRKGVRPVNPDGSAAKLSKAVPVYEGGNRYGWQTRGGAPILGSDGRPFISEVGR